MHRESLRDVMTLPPQSERMIAFEEEGIGVSQGDMQQYSFR